MSFKQEFYMSEVLQNQVVTKTLVDELNTVKSVNTVQLQNPVTLTATPVPAKKPPHRFQPGNRANPGGRPKGLASRIRAVTNDGEDLISFLVNVLNNEIKSTTKDRLQAAQILLDRGYGKAVETSVQIALDAKNGESTTAVDDLADAELESMARQLKSSNTVDSPALAPVLPQK